MPGSKASPDYGVFRIRHCTRPPQHPLRLGGRRRHLPHHAGDGGRDGLARRHDRAARTRVRLGECADLDGAGAAHPAVRLVRPVRRGVHESIRRPPRRRLCARLDRRGLPGVARDDAGVAAHPAVGRGHRVRHRSHRHRPRGDRRHAMVHAAARPGRRPSLGELGDRAAGVLAAHRRTDRALRLAHGAGFRLRPPCARRSGGRRVDARPAERSWASALRRNGGHAAAGDERGACVLAARAARGAERRRPRAAVLGPVRHLLHLRRQHQRPDPDPLHHLVRATMG